MDWPLGCPRAAESMDIGSEGGERFDTIRAFRSAACGVVERFAREEFGALGLALHREASLNLMVTVNT